jgi:hypothetical protein
MSQPSARPKLSHITLGKNLAGILASNCIGSDAEMLPPVTSGMYTSRGPGIIEGNGRGLMIHLTRGDILKQDADGLVNTVNSVGVLGRGVALLFRRAFSRQSRGLPLGWLDPEE